MSEIKNFFYKEFPKSCKKDDFWGQVKRTVNGKPVSQKQINMIVDAIKRGLQIQPKDCLLDLCCGNGALTTLISERCNKSLGVDFSEPLIDIAKNNFEKREKLTFQLQDVVEFSHYEINTQKYTKALCYGSFQYLSLNDSKILLQNLRRRFPKISHLFIGNLPDRDKVKLFYKDNNFTNEQLLDPCTAIGIWRTNNAFIKLAKQAGWCTQISYMPKNFYSSNYRYDAILSPENL